MKNPRQFRNLVGPQVREWRMAAGLSQNQLAVKLQLAGLTLDQIEIAEIENGMRSVYDYELPIIARGLQVSPDSLFPPKKELRKIFPTLLTRKIRNKPKI